MTTLLNVALASFTVTAVVLAVLGMAAWRRSRRPRTAVLAAGFAMFALAGAISTWWVFNREDIAEAFAVHAALSAVGLLSIYVALVKR